MSTLGWMVGIWVALSFILAWACARWFRYLKDGR